MAFSGKRIRQAREMNGFTQTELAVRVGVSQGLIGQVERNLKTASDELMHKISEQTHFPPSFFSQDPPVEFPPEALMFRAHADISLFKETEARRYAELVTEIALYLRKAIAPIPTTLPLVGGKTPEEAATLTRSALGLQPNEPIINLVREVEKAGVLVLGIPAELPGRSAFSLWFDKQPIIALIKGFSGAHLRLGVAHELGHLVMQHARLSKSDEEKDAFQYAGALLLPEAAMRREIITPVTLSSIASLKPRWMVSIQAIVRRAKDLNIINDGQYNYLNAQVSAKGWKKKEPGEFEPEKPRLLKQILEDVKGVSTEQLANELRMSPAFIRDVLERYADKSKQNGNDLIRTSQKITLLKRR